MDSCVQKNISQCFIWNGWFNEFISTVKFERKHCEFMFGCSSIRMELFGEFFISASEWPRMNSLVRFVKSTETMKSIKMDGFRVIHSAFAWLNCNASIQYLSLDYYLIWVESTTITNWLSRLWIDRIFKRSRHACRINSPALLCRVSLRKMRGKHTFCIVFSFYWMSRHDIDWAVIWECSWIKCSHLSSGDTVSHFGLRIWAPEQCNFHE